MDEFYIEYEERVAAGDLDPQYISIENYVEDRISSLIDRAELLCDNE